ncbi:cupin domain-containing protein [Sinorhizobium mexicanum]|uniref:Cupin domain-containing protein n=1 Tax=Sinorhizobium mexicanum TaxID=375549 RepID=A0A859QNT0_9HYPH|nr:cupin domain-containing protein [Sinorhizobium mexicanum]MBP1885143.1 transcriptional regulator with XRE-family HTH domain [Sinorhizobium mexicanum]QLL64400.1 cupin domain-containing protein [Sinorhizobium mexicanum]
MDIRSNDSDAPKIGVRIKHARLVRGLSLTELGAEIGVTEGYLSKLENDRSQASMATLHKLATALNTTISELYANIGSAQGSVFVVKSSSRPKLVTGHPRAGNRVVLEKLIPSGPGYLMQAAIHVIAPGGGNPEPLSHAGQEFGYVLKGKLELNVDAATVILDEGDSFYFESTLPHWYKNLSDGETRVLWANTPATF